MNLWNLCSTAAGLSLVFSLCLVRDLRAQKRKAAPLASCDRQVVQGLKGLIFEVSGNQMPSPGKGVPIRKGVQREFGIFKLSNLNQAVKGKDDCFFKNPGTSLVKRARSDKNGCFVLSLPPGKYSVFVREKGQWYANSFNGDGEICPVEVFPDSLSQLDFRINHGAWY